MDTAPAKKQEIVERFFKHGILLDAGLLSELSTEPDTEKIYRFLEQNPAKFETLAGDSKKFMEALLAYDSPQSVVLPSPSPPTLQPASGVNQIPPVKVLYSYIEPPQKISVQHFIDYFTTRHHQLEALLRNRTELRSVSSIKKIQGKKTKETAAIIGMVCSKDETKNGNILLTLEDQTGQIKALIHKNKPDLLQATKEIVLDEVVGITGTAFEDIIFVNNIIWPEVPLTKELKKADEEGYAVCISDLHVGSRLFLPEDFARFLRWIQGEIGTPAQKHAAQNVRYIFITGDLVDGVGIYPGQDKELAIPDIYEQYKECAQLLRQIPSHIPLIICPGNHDALRLAEPQPAFNSMLAKPLKELPNAILVSNPSLVRIAETPSFLGFDVLLYHGASFDHFVREVDTLRNKGGYNRGDLIMKFLLRRRHLAPTHGASAYLPTQNRDFLAIDTVPDFFLSGHIHKSIVGTYRNVTLISGSCWQAKTNFQEKMGHNPEPSRVPLINLKTREVKILKFEKEHT